MLSSSILTQYGVEPADPQESRVVTRIQQKQIIAFMKQRRKLKKILEKAFIFANSKLNFENSVVLITIYHLNKNDKTITQEITFKEVKRLKKYFILYYSETSKESYINYVDIIFFN